jgi:hypothetical protein
VIDPHALDDTPVPALPETLSASADSRTKEEQQQIRQPRLTPTDRLENALKDHIEGLRADKQRLADDLSELSRINSLL